MIEFHYAPIAGIVTKCVDGKHEVLDGWPAHTELMRLFLRLREGGQIKLLRTVTYGHPHYSGHSGRVDIYGAIEDIVQLKAEMQTVKLFRQLNGEWGLLPVPIDTEIDENGDEFLSTPPEFRRPSESPEQ